MTEKLKIIERYNEHAALIKLGHSYSVPSRVTKRHLLELLTGFGDDEVLNIAQIDSIDGVRPLIIKATNNPEPTWRCICMNEVQ